MRNRSINEIEELLRQSRGNLSNEQWQALCRDERKGVQRLLEKWERKKKKQIEQKLRYEQLITYEKKWMASGARRIGGVDEAGRGPLAGPVVAACVVLDEKRPLIGIDDSKRLSAQERLKLFERIQHESLAYAVGVSDVSEIDAYNIYEATKMAMTRAVKSLPIAVDHLLVDALSLPLSISQTSLIQGDARSASIAAASIVAKVTRDRIMEDFDRLYPNYGFKQHKGYATKSHLEAIHRQGVCRIHRRSFAPVARTIRKQRGVEDARISTSNSST